MKNHLMQNHPTKKIDEPLGPAYGDEDDGDADADVYVGDDDGDGCRRHGRIDFYS